MPINEDNMNVLGLLSNWILHFQKKSLLRNESFAAPSKALGDILLEKRVDSLCKGVFRECMISECDKGLIYYTEYTFACTLIGEAVRVYGHLDFFRLRGNEPDFHLNAKVKVLNISYEDSAISKALRALFCYGICRTYTCTIVQEVDPVFKDGIDEVKKQQIVEICKRANEIFMKSEKMRCSLREISKENI